MRIVVAPHSVEEARALLADSGDDPSFWGGLKRSVLELEPLEAWAVLLLLADATDDEDALSKLGVVVAEPLLELWGSVLVGDLEEAARSHPNLRVVLESVVLSPDQDEINESLDEIIDGRRPT